MASDYSPAKSSGVKLGEKTLASWSKGCYAAFEKVNLSPNIKSVEVKAAARGFQGHADGDLLEFRLDGPDGTLIGTCEVTLTKGYDDVKPFYASIDLAKNSGVHDVYIVSTIGRYDCLRFESFAFSTAVYEKKPYVPVGSDKFIDMGYDTLVAVNDLGQSLPDYEEVGAPKDGKTVAVFYSDWHDRSSSVLNINDVITKNPGARFEYDNPVWKVGTGTAYYWNEPLWGYYTSIDRWVIRRQIQMLTAAGVDALFLDNTNGNISWKSGYTVLFEELYQAKLNGLNPPKLAFMLPFGPIEGTAEQLKSLYLSIYKDKKYNDLWFYLDGKPLIWAYPTALDTYGRGNAENIALSAEIKEFFTFRYPSFAHESSTGYKGNGLYWQWLASSPLIKYNNEYVPVSVAQNAEAVPKTGNAMNAPYAKGRNYTLAYGFDYSDKSYKYNYNFNEQWAQAIDLDPSIVFVVGFNEWTSGPYKVWGYTPNGFPDQFDNINSRDIEPTKDKNLLDTTYYQLVKNIRKYKGVRKTAVASAQTTIQLDGSFDDWKDVAPTYNNMAGLTEARNALSRDPNVTYTNTTGRNGIVKSKAARDNENLYFYAETDKNITPQTDPNWMMLFINSDSNFSTGWNGYDYVINYGGAKTIKKNVGGTFNWEQVGTAELNVNANKLELKIPRALINVTGMVDLEFKWSDNMQEADIMDFWLNGNVAPLGRFNYKYTEIQQKDPVGAEAKGITAVKAGLNYAYVNGFKTKAFERDSRYTVRLINQKIYIPLELAGKAFNAKVEWETDTKAVIIKAGENTLRMVTGSDSIRVNGVLTKIDSPAQIIDGIPYISPEVVANACMYQAKFYDDVLIFGLTINDASAKMVVEKLK